MRKASEDSGIIPGMSGLLKIYPSRMAVGGQTRVLGGILFHHYKVGVRVKKSEAESRTQALFALSLSVFLFLVEGVSLSCEDGRRG